MTRRLEGHRRQSAQIRGATGTAEHSVHRYKAAGVYARNAGSAEAKSQKENNDKTALHGDE